MRKILQLSVVGTALLIIVTGCGGGGGDGGGGAPATLNISIAAMPDGVVGTPYNQSIGVTGGTGARTFSISVGGLPAGLMLDAATGAVMGTPAGPAGTVNFTIMVVDSGTPQQNDTQAFGITINAPTQGRNNTIATATTLGNGTFTASISPMGHPNTVIAPDEDYYRITTATAGIVTVDINARVNGSPIDSVIEIVAANGIRLNACVAPTYVDACVHDDEDLGVLLDSFLQVQLGGPTTFYVHVVDFRGDARPDMQYDIAISGVN